MVLTYFCCNFENPKAVHNGCLEDDFGDSGLSSAQVLYRVSAIFFRIFRKKLGKLDNFLATFNANS